MNLLQSLGLTLSLFGYPDQGLKRCYEALALARAGSVANVHSIASSQRAVVELHKFRREDSAAQEDAERLIALSAEHGLTLWLAIATTLRGCALAKQGRHEEGIAQIQEGLAMSRAIGSEVMLPGHLCWLAEACIETGRLDDGMNALTEALAAADEHEIRFYEAEMYRLKGELLLRGQAERSRAEQTSPRVSVIVDSNTAEAKNCFERALEIARKQSARSLELRATTSLARLVASQGRRDEARTMLAAIYNWFTEGFDTADLKDAKLLLEELSA